MSAFTVATKSVGSSSPLALERVEPGKRERHGVGAGPQIDDAVLSAAIADRRAHLLDQRVAGRFDGHARQHGARRVLDDAGDGGLGEGRCGQGPPSRHTPPECSRRVDCLASACTWQPSLNHVPASWPPRFDHYGARPDKDRLNEISLGCTRRTDARRRENQISRRPVGTGRLRLASNAVYRAGIYACAETMSIRYGSHGRSVAPGRHEATNQLFAR